MEDVSLLQRQTMMEQHFFQSLGHLCNLYQLPIPSVAHQPFPLSVLLAYEEVKHQMKTVAPHLQLVVVETGERSACLATVQTFSTDNTLYYIPIRPLADLLGDPARQVEAKLLRYVFAYLYHVVDVPWFMNTGNFLDFAYESLESWYVDMEMQGDQPDEEATTLETLALFPQMREASALVQKQLQKTKGLRGWLKCLRTSAPSESIGHSIKAIAQTAWEMYKAYPTRNLWNSIEPDLLYPECEETMRPDYYLSFFWDFEGDLYQPLMNFVNGTLQEYQVIDEPMNVQLFDKPQTTVTHTLEFEQKLFTLIEDLCTVLNELS